ncbi:MAG: hypothetical protein WAN11_02810 [Syntrophobacteraceae bacterium]
MAVRPVNGESSAIILGSSGKTFLAKIQTTGTRLPDEPFLCRYVQVLPLISDLRATIGLDENWRHDIFEFEPIVLFASEDFLQTI